MQTVTASFRTPSITSRTMNCQSRAVASNERSCASDRSEIDWIRSIPGIELIQYDIGKLCRAAVGPKRSNSQCGSPGAPVLQRPCATRRWTSHTPSPDTDERTLPLASMQSSRDAGRAVRHRRLRMLVSHRKETKLVCCYPRRYPRSLDDSAIGLNFR